MSTNNRWQFGKRQLDEGVAQTLTFDREVLRAWKRVGDIHILPLWDKDGAVLREEDWVPTRNEWRFGFTRSHGWAASNGKRAWQFRDRSVMESFANFMARTDWQLVPVAAA